AWGRGGSGLSVFPAPGGGGGTRPAARGLVPGPCYLVAVVAPGWHPEPMPTRNDDSQAPDLPGEVDMAHPLKLGLQLGYWTRGPEDPIDLVLEAERLGYDSVWTADAYGPAGFSPPCWIGARPSRIQLGTAVMQLSARTPACAAMTAMTIDHLSGGRLILGIGVSGPQVVEGWYGQPFPRPLERTREW